MITLQAEKFRDIIAYIEKETGMEPTIEWLNDGGIYFQIKIHVNIPKKQGLELKNKEGKEHE